MNISYLIKLKYKKMIGNFHLISGASVWTEIGLIKSFDFVGEVGDESSFL